MHNVVFNRNDIHMFFYILLPTDKQVKLNLNESDDVET